MEFEEYGTILYPYVTNNTELCYEVEVDGNTRNKIQYLPELPSDERWECFGINVSDDWEKSIVTVEVVPSYRYVD